MVDALALELKVDPIELRMNSFIGPEQFPYETTNGWTYDSGNYAETMRVAMDIAGYEELRREQAEKRARGELMGIGVAFFAEASRTAQAHGHPRPRDERRRRDLRVHPLGKAVVSISAQTQGQGHETTFAQIVAEESGSRPRTSRFGTATPTARRTGSAPTARSTPGPAQRSRSSPARCATRARLIAATMLETRPEDLAWKRAARKAKEIRSRACRSRRSRRGPTAASPCRPSLEGGLDAQVIYDLPNLTTST